MEAEMERGEPSKKPAKSMSEMFDLSGDKKVANYVQRYEELFRQREAANNDLKELASEALQDMLTKREVEAIKKIAKWRLDDKLGAAQELFSAMRRVGAAVKVNLFDWADHKAS